MTNAARILLWPAGLGNPPYSLLGVVMALGLVALGQTVRLWRHQRAGQRPPSARRLWYVRLAMAGPITLAVAQGAAYWPLLSIREVAWSWFEVRFGPWVGGDLAMLAWASTELVAACLVTTVAVWAIGRCARVIGLANPLDGYWLSNPVSALAGLLLFAVIEPAVKTDFEHWSEAMWLTRVLGVVPIYAWAFHLGSMRGGRTRG